MNNIFPSLEEIKNDNFEMFTAISAPLDKNLVVIGHPGTGKTVAAIHRFVKLFTEGKKVLFLCYNRLLREWILRTIIEIFNLSEESIKKNIKTLDSFFGVIQNKYFGSEKDKIKYINQMSVDEIKEIVEYWLNIEHYDVIIIDEGQDFSLEILESLEKLADHISIFMDKLQIINIFNGHTNIDYDFLEQEKDYNLLILTKNYRTPGNIYEKAISWFVSQNEDLIQTESLNTINGVIQRFNNKDINEIINEIEQIANESSGNIGIFINKVKNVQSFYLQLKNKFGEKISIKKYISEDDEKENIEFSEKIIVTTFKSSKGLEFHNVIVLITPEDKEIKNINNQLFVLSTRTRNNIRFYFLDKNEI